MKRAIGIGLLSAALCAASAASADQERHARAFSRATDRVEARLAYLHTALKITDAQQAQWSAFAETMRKMAAERDQRRQAMRAKWHERKEAMKGGKHEHRRPSVIERMQRAQQMHADAVARINEILAVEKPLYEALSPEQKQVADVVLVPHRHGGDSGRGHGFGGGGFGRG